MINLAERLATRLSKPGIDREDIASAAILACVRTPTRYVRGAVIDAIRSVVLRQEDQLSAANCEPVEPDYVARLALKRCGVLMLNCLHPTRRRVILLRYWWMLTQAETAVELGISPGRVGQLEREACAQLRCVLEERGIRSMRDVV
jgi:DNA-directed RNA polymerase specialized sigma24 family protein